MKTSTTLVIEEVQHNFVIDFQHKTKKVFVKIRKSSNSTIGLIVDVFVPASHS